MLLGGLPGPGLTGWPPSAKRRVTDPLWATFSIYWVSVDGNLCSRAVCPRSSRGQATVVRSAPITDPPLRGATFPCLSLLGRPITSFSFIILSVNRTGAGRQRPRCCGHRSDTRGGLGCPGPVGAGLRRP